MTLSQGHALQLPEELSKSSAQGDAALPCSGPGTSTSACFGKRRSFSSSWKQLLSRAGPEMPSQRCSAALAHGAVLHGRRSAEGTSWALPGPFLLWVCPCSFPNGFFLSGLLQALTKSQGLVLLLTLPPGGAGRRGQSRSPCAAPCRCWQRSHPAAEIDTDGTSGSGKAKDRGAVPLQSGSLLPSGTTGIHCQRSAKQLLSELESSLVSRRTPPWAGCWLFYGSG